MKSKIYTTEQQAVMIHTPLNKTSYFQTMADSKVIPTANQVGMNPVLTEKPRVITNEN